MPHSDTWVYVRSEPGLWTVGFHSPDGQWHPDSDYDRREDAATRAHWLNGGEGTDVRGRRDQASAHLSVERVAELAGFTDPRVVREVIEDAARISAATGVGQDDVARVLGQLGGWDLPACRPEEGR